MTINTSQFEIKILQKLNSSANTSDIQALVNAKEFLKSTDIVVVTNYSDLPAASSVPAGSLYFVESDELLYIPAQNIFGSTVWRQLYDRDYGVIWGSGINGSGQIGDNTTINKSSPVSLIGGFTDWCQITTGFGQSVGLRQNGTIWAWGNGTEGRLGNNSTGNQSSPVSVVGGITDWTKIDTGEAHSLAIRSNGTMWAWGSDFSFGRLGDGGGALSRLSPVSVVGGFTDWCQVSAGSAHSAGIRENGTLWTWGSGATGRLGNNCTTSRCSPVSVVGGFTDWCQVSVNGSSAAIRINGTLWTWGSAANGIAGTNSTVSRSSPTCISGTFADWCQVSVGASHMVAIRTGGTMWSWGSGVGGLLGDGATTNKSSPISVVGGFTDWCQVSAGCLQTVAVRTNGTLWAWGCGSSGQIGNQTTTNRSSPTSVVGGFTDWCQATTSGSHIMAIRRRIF